MVEQDDTYYLRRLTEELEAASLAVCPNAAYAHTQMADLYAQLCAAPARGEWKPTPELWADERSVHQDRDEDIVGGNPQPWPSAASHR